MLCRPSQQPDKVISTAFIGENRLKEFEQLGQVIQQLVVKTGFVIASLSSFCLSDDKTIELNKFA